MQIMLGKVAVKNNGINVCIYKKYIFHYHLHLLISYKSVYIDIYDDDVFLRVKGIFLYGHNPNS